MKVFNLLKNLWQRAKSYSDSNLQTSKEYAVSVRNLDYANLENPLSSSVTAQWTYTATKDGILILDIIATTREYLTSTVNGKTTWHFTPMFISNSTIPMLSVLQMELSKDDVFVLSGLRSTCYLSPLTNFVPYKIGGVILNLLNNRRVVVA